MHRNICAGDVLVLCSDGIIPGQEGADEQIAAALKQLEFPPATADCGSPPANGSGTWNDV